MICATAAALVISAGHSDAERLLRPAALLHAVLVGTTRFLADLLASPPKRSIGSNPAAGEEAQPRCGAHAWKEYEGSN